MDKEVTDEILIRKYIELGDVQSLTLLIDRYLPHTLVLFTRLIHNAADAEDVTQSVFLRILRQLAEGRSINHFAPFFAACCRNAFRDYLRQKKRHSRVVAVDTTAAQEQIALSSLQRWQYQHSEISLAQLDLVIGLCLEKYDDDHVRGVLSDHLAGYSLKEIAARNGCSVSTASTLWHRNKQELLRRILVELSF